MNEKKEQQVIQRKIKKGHSLSLHEQLAIFEMEEPAKWLRLCMRFYKIYFPEVEKRMVELANASLLNFYFREYTPKASTIEYMFEEKNIPALEIYVRYNLLSEENQIRLINLRNLRLLTIYFDNWYLDPNVQEYLLENGSQKMIRAYITNHAFTAPLEVVFVGKNITSLLRFYVRRHHLHKKARFLMFNVANAEVIQAHVNKWSPVEICDD